MANGSMQCSAVLSEVFSAGLLAGSKQLAKFVVEGLAHRAVSHFVVALDTIAQLVNSLLLVHRFILFLCLAPPSLTLAQKK